MTKPGRIMGWMYIYNQEQVYDAVLSGAITKEEFIAWSNYLMDTAYEDGHNAGQESSRRLDYVE